MAKVLAREIPSNILRDGEGDDLGLDFLIRALTKRWGPRAETNQLELLDAYEHFRPLQGESIEDVMTRFEIVHQRATDEAGLTASNASKAQTIFKMFRIPADQWALLLAPCAGQLPTATAQFNAYLTPGR